MMITVRELVFNCVTCGYLSLYPGSENCYVCTKDKDAIEYTPSCALLNTTLGEWYKLGGCSLSPVTIALLCKLKCGCTQSMLQALPLYEIFSTGWAGALAEQEILRWLIKQNCEHCVVRNMN